MTATRDHGKVLEEVASKFLHKKPKTVLLFIIDGCRADALYSALDRGGLPNLKKLMESTGFTRFEECITAFPSVTITSHASIITGVWPGTHGIVGNEWFIRKQWGLYPDSELKRRKEFYKVTREYVKLSIDSEDPGLANLSGNYFEIANCDSYGVENVHESFARTPSSAGNNAHTASIYEMISRGALDKKYLFIDDLKGALQGRVLGLINAIRKVFTRKEYLSFANKGLDSKAFEELLNGLEKTTGKDGRLFTVWLPGMDGYSHENGAKYQNEYFRSGDFPERILLKNMDSRFEILHRYLKQKSALDDTLIVITADHGQYDCTDSTFYTNEFLYRQLHKEKTVMEGEILPLTHDGTIDKLCRDASVIIMGNGGACHVYVKSSKGWGETPGPERLAKFLPFFESHPAVDKIFVRDATENVFKVWANGTLQSLSHLDEMEYPFAEERVNSLAATMRSGDIILSARKECYFAEKPMKGEHGSIRAEDSCVPLLFIHPQLSNRTVVTSRVRTIDITPTVLALSTGAFERRAELGIINKLETILSSLEMYASFTQGKQKDIYRKSIAVEVEDARNNFECKLAFYHDNGTITDDDHERLLKRFMAIPLA